MSQKIVLFVCAILIHICQATFYPTNETDLSRCKIHYARTGTTYTDFYTLTDPKQNNSMIDFHFSVLAPSDAHILLATSSQGKKEDPAYEIVIGAGGNTFSDIRRMQKSEVKASIRIKGLLSALDVRSFWIHMSKDGVLEVGREGEELAFITWTDTNPLPIHVISFSTWPGVEAKWYFDCIRDEIKHIPKNLTYVEKLRKDLLPGYDPYVRPVINASDFTVVHMRLLTHSLTFDERNSIFEIKGIGNLVWQDEKLLWDPKNYGGLSSIHIFGREIWQPDFILYNAVNTNVRNVMDPDSMLIVSNTGRVEWSPMFHAKAWCSDVDLGKWPNDNINCTLYFSFWAELHNLVLQFNANTSSVYEHFFSEWSVEEVTVSTTGQPDSFINEPPTLQLRYTIKRTSAMYHYAFFMPFVVYSISLLIIFWSSPFGNIKISLGCFDVFICVLMLIAFGFMLPVKSDSVPNIVLLYTAGLLASVLSILISILVINISRIEHSRTIPRLLTKVLVSKVLKYILCLPDIKVAEEYGKLSEISLPKLKENRQHIWVLLGTTIDRLAFFVYLGLIVYAYCVHLLKL